MSDYPTGGADHLFDPPDIDDPPRCEGCGEEYIGIVPASGVPLCPSCDPGPEPECDE